MAEPFANEPIAVDDLPQLRDETFIPVDPRYLRVSLISIAIGAAVIAVGGAAIASRAERPWVAIAVVGAMLALLGLRAIVRTMEVRRMAYLVRAHDLSMRSGVITHRTASLPFARVQHVRVHRGAIERALGLATLHVSSAGPNITIPGLAAADAERIKLLVTERAGDVEPDAPATAPETTSAPVPRTPPTGAPTTPPTGGPAAPPIAAPPIAAPPIAAPPIAAPSPGPRQPGAPPPPFSGGIDPPGETAPPANE